MQLNIYELNENDAECTENHELMDSSFEEIPENIIPVKKKVTQSILKKPLQIPSQMPSQMPSQKPLQKPKISYEDILLKMGMFVSDGKLHLVDRNSGQNQSQNQSQNEKQNHKQNHKQNQFENQNQYVSNIPQNSYIHNKYFKSELQHQNTITPPKTLEEYKKRVIENYIERLRIKQIKSKKLLMPTSNINMANGNSSNLNKFFRFK